MKRKKNTMNHTQNCKRGGFTLIELVVAILVFAIGIVGIMKMHQASIQANNFSMQLTDALTIANSKVDYLRRLGVSNTSMTIGNHNTPNVSSLSTTIPYTMTWNVAFTPNSVNLSRDVVLTIQWQDKAVPRSVIMPTITVY